MKNEKLEHLKQYLHQSFQGIDSFLKEIIYPIFGEDNVTSYNQNLIADNPELKTLASSSGIKEVKRFAQIELDFYPIDIFEVTVTDKVKMARNRVSIQQVIRRCMDSFSGAFMIFHYDNNWEWRFTFCSKGKDNTEFTDNKRYTFLLGKDQSCRTAAENFLSLIEKREKNIDLKEDDLIVAFSVEALSKRFFDDYKKQYLRFVEYLNNPKNGNFEKFSAVIENCQNDKDKKSKTEKCIRDYVKKLLGRIVFIQFLQKKGWMGVVQGSEWGSGDLSFLKNLFKYSNNEQKADFLDEILEPLFSGALDSDRRDNFDLFDTKVELPQGSVVKIPYLNGGLFERDSLDETVIKFPSEYFEFLFDLFDQYNFTIDENDPNDAVVGVDPEMLGRIFENLLEDNKDKGAYYTPKEIVYYMCRESLISYLQIGITNKEDLDSIELFVKTHDVAHLGGNESLLSKKIDQKLIDVKICDPAIGSGAFPMGLLKELCQCRLQLEKASSLSQLKKFIIQNNIYGVDIEKGAVDIARLRFWLSIVLDENSPESLPNLDYKVMQGNSLLESFMGIDLSKVINKSKKKNNQQTSLLFDSDASKDNINVYISKYFLESDHSKKIELKKEIDAAVKDHLKICVSGNEAIVKEIEKIKMPNEEFFLWHTYFNDIFNRPNNVSGFDIVIGNPPYGAKIKKELTVQIKNFYKSSNTIKGKQKGSLDTFTIFIELALNCLPKNGICNFILPLSITSSESMEGIHKLIFDSCEKIKICSFGDRPKTIFDSVEQQVAIIKFIKTNTKVKHLLSTEINKRFANESIDSMLEKMKFIDALEWSDLGKIPKISYKIEQSILKKLNLFKNNIGQLFVNENAKGTFVYYRKAGGRYFKLVTMKTTNSSAEGKLLVEKKYASFVGAIMSSNLFYWYWLIYSDWHNLKIAEISRFPLQMNCFSDNDLSHLTSLYNDYLSDLEKNSKVMKSGLKCYYARLSKQFIDKIDIFIGKKIGLSSDEIDFIINYDAKYRITED